MTSLTLPTDDGEQPFTEYQNDAKKVLNVSVDISLDGEAWGEKIKDIVRILCPFLLRDDPSCCLQLKPLTGGLSNHLFLVSNSNFLSGSEGERNTVLVRIHPDSDHKEGGVEGEEKFSIVNREMEPKFAAWLASQKEGNNISTNMGPTIYGRFQNGRVEEFYNNVRPLTWGEMSEYTPWIAERLAAFHSLENPPSDILPRPATDRDANIFATITSWLSESTKSSTSSNIGGNDNTHFLQELSQEWLWLENELASPPCAHQQQFLIKNGNQEHSALIAEAFDFIRKLSVTHMDCQPLNILIDNDVDKNGRTQSENRLRLIDFEYAGWNPIAADIANTFCEFCEMSNLCADYDKEYPTKAQQENFFWHYILRADPCRADRFLTRSQMWHQERGTGNPISNEGPCVLPKYPEWDCFCATLELEVGRFSLLSHLGWAIWSVVKAKEEDGIDFDYMKYARHRMEGYAWAKKKFILESC